MEWQACINQHEHTDADIKLSHYSKGYFNINAEAANNQSTQMRVLFSGRGKAERNMGMAALPALTSLNTTTDFSSPTQSHT